MPEDKALGLKAWLSGPKQRQSRAEKLAEGLSPLDMRRIAVLPFSNLSPSAEDEYFSDGMTEELIATLSKVPSVEVISRTSVMQYKKSPKPIKEVSRELNVGTVLEGSVRKMGNKVRISIKMIDAGNDRHLWAESYDRELQDVFAIQTELATKVAEAVTLQPHNNGASLRKKPTSNMEAYTLYLKGRYHWNKRGLEDVKNAMDCFEQALKKDPKFALGYVGLADCLEILSTTWSIDSEANHGKSKSMVAQALELDPSLAEAHATRGLYLLNDFKLTEAEQEFRNALALNPNYATAHNWYYLLLLIELRWAEAYSQIEKAVELDPLSTIINMNYGSYYGARKDFRTAIDLLERSVELGPRNSTARLFLAWAYGKSGMIVDAKREYMVAVELLQKTYPLVGKLAETWLAFFQEDKEMVRSLLTKVQDNLEEAYADASAIAFFRFYLGDLELGFQWLERSLAKKENSLLYIQSWWEIPDNVRTDERYRNILRKIGLI